MSARDELALVLANAQRFRNGSSALPSAGHVSRLALDDADAVLAAGYSKPRTISTIDELDALAEIEARAARIAAFEMTSAEKDRAYLLDLVREQAAKLEAVRGLHVAEGNGSCIVCWDFNNDTDVRFPCPTFEATK